LRNSQSGLDVKLKGNWRGALAEQGDHVPAVLDREGVSIGLLEIHDDRCRAIYVHREITK